MTEQEICESYRKAEYKAKQVSILAQLTLKPASEIKEILKRNGYMVPEVKHRKPKTEEAKSAAVEETKSLPTAVLITITEKIDSLDKQITDLDKLKNDLMEQLSDLTAFLESYGG